MVSVIVPVYNDAVRLGTCLAAVRSQTYPGERYKVLVVDNGSDEDQRPVADDHPWVQVIREEAPGSYAARNRGLALAQGEVLAFTDADCVPSPDWIEKGVNVLESRPNAGLVGGQVRLFARDPEHPTPVELYDCMFGFPQEYFVRKLHFAPTANLFTRRCVVERVGRFRAELKSGGDTEWGTRVASHGYEVVYGEAVCVAHPARRSLRELRLRSARVAGGLYDINTTVRPSRVAVVKNLLKSLVPPVNRARVIFTDRRSDVNTAQRLEIVLAAFVDRYSQAIEYVRLIIGGSSRRS